MISKEVEHLRDRTVMPPQQKILEIIPGNRSIDICNAEGTIVAERQYKVGSPVDKTVKLLMQLISTGVYE
jgi:hypothetical protein